MHVSVYCCVNLLVREQLEIVPGCSACDYVCVRVRARARVRVLALVHADRMDLGLEAS